MLASTESVTGQGPGRTRDDKERIGSGWNRRLSNVWLDRHAGRAEALPWWPRSRTRKLPISMLFGRLQLVKLRISVSACLILVGACSSEGPSATTEVGPPSGNGSMVDGGNGVHGGDTGGGTSADTGGDALPGGTTGTGGDSALGGNGTGGEGSTSSSPKFLPVQIVVPVSAPEYGEGSLVARDGRVCWLAYDSDAGTHRVYCESGGEVAEIELLKGAGSLELDGDKLYASLDGIQLYSFQSKTKTKVAPNGGQLQIVNDRMIAFTKSWTHVYRISDGMLMEEAELRENMDTAAVSQSRLWLVQEAALSSGRATIHVYDLNDTGVEKLGEWEGPRFRVLRPVGFRETLAELSVSGRGIDLYHFDPDQKQARVVQIECYGHPFVVANDHLFALKIADFGEPTEILKITEANTCEPVAEFENVMAAEGISKAVSDRLCWTNYYSNGVVGRGIVCSEILP